MESAYLESLATLRAVVGYLGEREQYGWWQSSFFAPFSEAYLAPVFPRSALAARCHGATRAACIAHDEHIGVGNVYHLFRLQEGIEQGIHRILHEPDACTRIAAPVADRDRAMRYLQSTAGDIAAPGVGPTRVGALADLGQREPWRAVAAHYAEAFAAGSHVYPYFADRS